MKKDMYFPRFARAWLQYLTEHRLHTEAPLLAPDATLLARLESRIRFARHRRTADAAVLLAMTDEDDPRILLSRRADTLKQHAGEVSLPGGKRDPSDTSNIAVALREAWEETALDPFAVRLLGELPTQMSKSGMRVKPIVGIIPKDVALNPHPGEIDKMFFIRVSQLLNEPPVPYRVQMKAGVFVVPSFRVEDQVVWGLTGRILVDLVRYGLGKKIDWPIFYVNHPERPVGLTMTGRKKG